VLHVREMLADIDHYHVNKLAMTLLPSLQELEMASTRQQLLVIFSRLMQKLSWISSRMRRV
jgi:hypothetical protein